MNVHVKVLPSPSPETFKLFKSFKPFKPFRLFKPFDPRCGCPSLLSRLDRPGTHEVGGGSRGEGLLSRLPLVAFATFAKDGIQQVRLDRSDAKAITEKPRLLPTVASGLRLGLRA